MDWSQCTASSPASSPHSCDLLVRTEVKRLQVPSCLLSLLKSAKISGPFTEKVNEEGNTVEFEVML